MTKEELVMSIKKAFSSEILELNEEAFDPIVFVDKSKLMDVMKRLKEQFDFNYLMCISGVDYPPEKIELVYHLFSMEKKYRICIKVNLPRETPSVSSVVPIWKGAEWHERETYDLLGVTFENHPDLRRILLPEEFSGHPLRKDYMDEEVLPLPDSKEMMKPPKKP